MEGQVIVLQLEGDYISKIIYLDTHYNICGTLPWKQHDGSSFGKTNIDKKNN